MALLERRCLAHSLNIKAIARRYASEHGTSYEQLRLIVVHLGGGISVTAHENGRMIESLNADEDSPFSTERAGGVPARQLVRLCFSGKYTFKQIDDMLCRKGGLFSYLGTTDLIEVERRIAASDAKAALVFEAMVYQNVKEIGAMAAVLRGHVDAILLTGGMARSKKLVGDIEQGVSWIAPVVVYPGEDELQALAEGVLRVLRCEELPCEFNPEPELVAMA
jgi:butyrate kinase